MTMANSAAAAARASNNDSGISRAKIRSIQQTVVVILMYIASSMPFVFVQLWAVWGSPGEAVSKDMLAI